MGRVRVIGCGLRGGGDDELGLRAADMLGELLPEGIEVRADSSGGANVLDWCEGVDVLILIDAAQATTDAPPGTLLRFVYPVDRERFVQTRTSGSHAISIAAGLGLAENLGLLPPKVLVFALAAEGFKPLRPFSEALKEPLASLIETVRQEAMKQLAVSA